MSVRAATIEDAPQIARVHVDSWRSTYSRIISEDFLAAMSYKDFEARWRGWLRGEFGFHMILEQKEPGPTIRSRLGELKSMFRACSA